MAFYKYVEATGLIAPDTAELLDEVKTEYKDTLGQGLNVDPETPQGVFITGETAARTSVVENNCALANQFNPNVSGGIYLDSVMALTGAKRKDASFSSVLVTVAGQTGTTIPAGSRIQSTVTSAIFALAEDFLITSPDPASASFIAIESGPIAAPAGSLTQILDGVPGWETATNPTDASLGKFPQSDQGARLFRRNTLALQASSLAQAIMAEVLNTKDVRSMKFRQNWTNSPMTVDGVTLVPHSMYACVDGGTDFDVATAIQSRKHGGCNFNGSTTVTIEDPNSHQMIPVKFDRPDIISIVVRATITAEASVADPVGEVKQAITDYAAGLLEGDNGLQVGVSVSCFQIAGGIAREVEGIFVNNLEISLASPIVYSNNPIPIEIFQIASIVGITVVVL